MIADFTYQQRVRVPSRKLSPRSRNRHQHHTPRNFSESGSRKPACRAFWSLPLDYTARKQLQTAMEPSQQLRFAPRASHSFVAPSGTGQLANGSALTKSRSKMHAFEPSKYLQPRLPQMSPAAVDRLYRNVNQERSQPSLQRAASQDSQIHHYKHHSSSMDKQQHVKQQSTATVQRPLQSWPSHLPPSPPHYPSQVLPNQISAHTNRIQLSANLQRVNHNEEAERIRLEKERARQRDEYTKRVGEFTDPNVIYYNYREALEFRPLRRGEHPSPYLLGLLANQTLPADLSSDRAVAIQYAKENWMCYWELKDLDRVVEEAKKAAEEKMRRNSQVTGRLRRPGT